MACDPNFASVGLLVLGNSAPGSTAFVDSSTNAFALTNSGTTDATAANPLFGQNTILIGNSYVESPVIAVGGPLDLATVQNWTIECWVFSPALASKLFLGAGNYNSNSGPGFFLQTTGANAVICDLFVGGSPQAVQSGTVTMAANTWTHVALVCNGGKYSLYTHGQTTSLPVGPFTMSSWNASGAGVFAIGGMLGSGSFFNGQIAGVRVTNGLALYTANFTPPAAPFPTINCTQSVPNLVGDTATQAIAANAAAGYVTTVQEANHPTAPAGIVISQQPPAGTLSVLGTNVILQLSVGPVTTAGMGGDVWGSTGGGNIQAQGQTPIGQALAYATQPDNAVVQGSQSVLASLSTGAVSPATAAAVTQNTPASQVPTAPTMG